MAVSDYFKGITDYGGNFDDEVRRKLHYNPKTGELTWKFLEGNTHSIKTYNGKCGGKVAGSVFTSGPSVGYRQLKIQGKTLLAHRVAWFLHTGRWPIRPIDHIDRNRDNNCILNLKLSCGENNQKNRSRCVKNTSGVTGVSWQKTRGKWRAAIGVKGKTIVLGTYDNLDDAAQARKEAEKFYGFSPTHGATVAPHLNL